ncbi:tektin-1-like [Daphnia pulicaria]|uniref:tektin-1-like n=1 Tax=Daphnia pulicaria TaxID=35523 RepID=UPI001EEC39C3|nr:tektin-1-like [Daphnia pulicaria]
MGTRSDSGGGAYTTPTEWKLWNQTKLSQSQFERLTAERLNAESKRLRDDVGTRVTSSRREVSQQFSTRIRDLQYWSTNLESKTSEVGTEIDALLQCQAQLQRMHHACGDPIAVVEQCLQLRERRSHVDRCLDEVQSSLHDELRTLRQGEMVLGRTVIEAAEQIRLLRSAKYQLDRDLADKGKASEIDSTTVGLADSVVGDGRTPRLLSDLVHSSQVNATVHFPWSTPGADLGGNDRNAGAITKANRQTTPTEWQSFTERNIQEASEQVHRSLQLRVTAMSVMQDIIRDTRSHANQVDQLFHDVIDRTRKALGALKSEHSAVCQQIQETEETASGLRAAIGAQDAPLGSAIQQLARRTARPNVEFCRDSVQNCLETRVDVVRTSLRQLQEKLSQADASLRRLRQSKFDLEQEIAVKEATLRIDAEHCMNALRRNMVLPQP